MRYNGNPKIKILLPVCIGLLMGGWGRTQEAAKSSEKYVLIEAETVGSGTIAADRTASGGKYVHRDGDYQPVLFADVPQHPGESLTVWVRYRGVGLQLKGVGADDKQTEIQWLYDAPKKFTWASFGTFPPSQLGSKIVIIRAPGGGEDSGVDAVVFAADKAFDPKTALSVPAAEAVTVRVAWQTKIGKASRLSYGLNAFHGFDPVVTGNAAYRKNMAYMNPGLVRLHNWDVLGDAAKTADGWLDYETHTWDRAKIKAALTGAYAYGPALLLNIPGWPAWMDANHDDLLDADQYDNYAKLCADLVQIVNKDLKRNVKYWEITNERDGPYYQAFHADGGRSGLIDAAKPDKVGELVTIFNRCAAAMKRIDPTIHTGGPAVARPDFNDFITRFVRGTASSLDFFSYHGYASGSRTDSDASVFDHTGAYGAFARSIRAILKKEIPQRTVPAFLDEYNISWTWETRDPRMTDNKGAVYDALVIAASVGNGADGTTAWNDRDGIYGKMDGEDRLRLPAHNFALFNTYGIGDCVVAESSDSLTVVAYAVQSTKHYALWIINRSEDSQAVGVTGEPLKSLPATVKQYQIAAKGYTAGSVAWASGAVQHLTVPAFSVTVFVWERN